MMKYYYKTIGDKKYRIPFDELKNSVEKLNISFDDAVQMWLEDNEIEVNEEQENLNKKANANKESKLMASGPKAKPAAPRKKKVSEEKKELFNTILRNLDRAEGVFAENITVLNENKLISCTINSKVFKINLIETRQKKES